MDLSTWTWAITQLISAFTTVFGYALTCFGVASVSLTILILFAVVVRLIVMPIVGRSTSMLIDNAMFGTSREIAREKWRAKNRASFSSRQSQHGTTHYDISRHK